jgi:hypothetical protein
MFQALAPKKFLTVRLSFHKGSMEASHVTWGYNPDTKKRTKALGRMIPEQGGFHIDDKTSSS